jgi:hypothetical protein
MCVSPLEHMLFAPSLEVRRGYAQLLFQLYCTAMEVRLLETCVLLTFDVNECLCPLIFIYLFVFLSPLWAA